MATGEIGLLDSVRVGNRQDFYQRNCRKYLGKISVGLEIQTSFSNEWEKRMLTKIHLENFRGFSGAHEVPLGKITLLYGPNSGGKSSVLRAMSLLSSRAGEDRVHPLFSLPFSRDDGLHGSFEANINNHNTGGQLMGIGVSAISPMMDGESGVHGKPGGEIGLKFFYDLDNFPLCQLNQNGLKDIQVFSKNYHFRLNRPTSLNLKKLQEVGFEKNIAFWMMAASQITSEIELPKNSFSRIPDDIFQLAGVMTEVFSSKELNNASLGVISKENDLLNPEILDLLKRFEVRVSGSAGSGDFFFADWDGSGFGDLSFSNNHPAFPVFDLLCSFFCELNAALSTAGNGQFIGPMRAFPRRHHLTSITNVKNEYDAGAHFPYQHHSDDKVQQVNKWLSKMGFPYRLEIQKTGNRISGEIVTPVVVKEDPHLVHALSEVGFGISQVIPILALGVDGKGLALIEQPEIHLHPRMQADLADFFIERINDIEPTIELFRPMENQLIIETHSEAMMHRIQRRIREGEISHSDVSVVYIDSIPGKGSVATPLRLNEQGDFIDEWPGGFFEDDFGDIFDLGSL
jgi:energy-coupling factor transporter ATP-binding protein EcfA2